VCRRCRARQRCAQLTVPSRVCCRLGVTPQLDNGDGKPAAVSAAPVLFACSPTPESGFAPISSVARQLPKVSINRFRRCAAVVDLSPGLALAKINSALSAAYRHLFVRVALQSRHAGPRRRIFCASHVIGRAARGCQGGLRRLWHYRGNSGAVARDINALMSDRCGTILGIAKDGLTQVAHPGFRGGGLAVRRPGRQRVRRAAACLFCGHCEQTGRTRDRSEAFPVKCRDGVVARSAGATRTLPWC